MKSSDSNTSLSTNQWKPSQQNVLERAADRSAKFFLKKTWLQFMFRKNVIDFKNPEMLKFISQNGRTLSLKNRQINLKKTYSK